MSYVTAERYLYLETPLPENDLLLTGFTGHEAISQLFNFQLRCKATNETTVSFEKLLGQKISFGINGPPDSGEPRHFQGIAVQIAQLGRGAEFTDYSMAVVPKAWTLTQVLRSRIFQHMTVPDILKEVLANQDVAFEIQNVPGQFEPREYCVQYQESDFDFASRLMEEEGIYYFFKFAKGSHKLVLANTMQSHPNITGEPNLIFDMIAGGGREEERIWSWKKAQEFRSGKFTLWDHHFELPHKPLSADQTVRDSISVGKITHKLKLAGNDGLEIYENPGRYAQRFDGIDKGGGENADEVQKIFQDNKRTVAIRIQQVETSMVLIEGESNCRHLTAGHKFNLNRHYDGDGQYVVVSVFHDAQEGHFRSSQANDEEHGHATNTFTCIPFGLPFSPPRNTPRPTIKGCQTAVVTGPKGEEIFTDKYGRIKVQFHWDREGKNDGDSSCWLRVATPWGGKQWGMVSIPRIGQEVLVDFIEGDMDRPIVVGSLYNADQMPPYSLPGKKVVSGWKSNSTIGGGGYNEMSMDDTKKSEMITIHAQKDMQTTVEHDDTQTVHNDRVIFVDGTHTETIKKNTTITVTEGNETNTVKQEIVITSQTAHVHIEACTEIQLHVGASKLLMKSDGKIELDGVDIAINGSSKVSVHGGEVASSADTTHSISGATVVSDGSATNTVKGGMVMLNP